MKNLFRYLFLNMKQVLQFHDVTCEDCMARGIQKALKIPVKDN